MTDLDNLDLAKLVVDLGTPIKDEWPSKSEMLTQDCKDDAENERREEFIDIDEDEEADYGRRG